MSRTKGMKHYPRDVKLAAVRSYMEEGKSQAEIIESLGINDTRRVQRGLHQYREEKAK